MGWTEEEDKLNSSGSENNQDEGLSRQVANASASDERLWGLLEKTLNDNLVEKRRARRWRLFFRAVTLSVFVAFLVYLFQQVDDTDVTLKKDFVAIVPVEGVIGSGEAVDANQVVGLLEDAYEYPHLKAVVLKMNSPGGSPVHAGIIYDAIQRQRKAAPSIPVIVVVEDMAASGGYYIAAAADEIYADKASLVGSIGVISAGFNAAGLLDKLGVERRVFTAGENKAFLDPFSPMTDKAKSKWQAVLDETHKQFIQAVKEGRGERLKETPDLFSGMVFTGTQAVDLGLIDGLQSLHQILKGRFSDMEVMYFEPEQEPWEELGQMLGASFVSELMGFSGLK